MNEEELRLESTLRTRRAQVNDEQWLEQAEARERQERSSFKGYWLRLDKAAPPRGLLCGRWFFWVSTFACGFALAAAVGLCAYAAIFGGVPKP